MNTMRPRRAGSPSEAQALLLEQCGGAQAAGDFVGKARSTAYKWTDPDQSEGAPFNVVATLSEHFRATAAAEHLALRAGGVFLPIPRADAEGWGGLSAAAAEETGRLLSEIWRALDPASEAGARVGRAEADAILRDVETVMRTVAAMRALALKARGDEGETRT